jgi:predicted RNA-binding protein YlxR (DUF448 family)
LLRVVAIDFGADRVGVVPDPARKLPGRGASLHPDPACLALAERRRVFGRALRVSGVLDTGALAEAVITAAAAGAADGGCTSPTPDKQGKDDRHEHTMKSLT